jgi:hypothetical protein
MRQLIVDAALTRLGTITIVNGYATDIGYNAFWWRRQPLHDDQLPAVVGFDTDDTITGEGSTIGMKSHNLTLEIEICATDDESPEMVRAAMNDVSKMESNTAWLPVAADAWCEVVAATMTVEEAENKQAAARVTLVVYYEAARGTI